MMMMTPMRSAPARATTRGSTARSSAPALSPAARRRGVPAPPRATQNGNPPPPAPPSGDDAKKAKFDAMLAQLRATGLNQEKARRLLKAWAKAGAMEPEQLKRLLARRSIAPARALGIQSALDLGAGAFGFFAGSTIGQAADFPGQIFLQLACYFGAMWYSISSVAGGAALVQVVLAARRYSASADVLLAAVRQMAGPEGVAAAAAEAGGGVTAAPGALAANVALAVSTAKVVAALDAIAEQLKAMDGKGQQDGDAPIPRSTLASLAAYLTVQHAEEKLGFKPADYGLSEKEAADIAVVFAMYDTNENFVLEREELSRMCIALGRDLSNAELDEAARLMMAVGGNGPPQPVGAPTGVTFPAFVAWFTGKAASKA